MPWVCERCGHLLDGNDPPCPQCDHPRLEQVRREHVPDQYAPSTLFVWRCPDCGHAHDSRRARCAECDRVGLDPAYLDGTDDVEVDRSGDATAERGVGRFVGRHADGAVNSTAWLVGFGVGLLTTILGFLFLVGGSPRFGAPIFVAGLFAMPSVRDRVGALLGTRPPGWFAGLVYVIALVAAVGLYNV